jgi:tRNA pseudouridine55 synthase
MADGRDVARRPVAGIVLLDKPTAITSNRALQRVKRLFRASKAGHTGTLDPLATGMLPICLGAATKVSGLMLAASKRYRVEARLGVATDTGDITGQEIERRERVEVDAEALSAAVTRMAGATEQVPPMYSALKHGGKRLYELARAGADVPRPPRPIRIFELELEAFAWPDMTLYVHCSKGTYVRSLIGDLAAELGNLAHVTALRRLGVGPYSESQMVSLATLEQAAAEGLDSLDRWLLGIDTALMDRPAVAVSHFDVIRLRNGCRVSIEGPAVGAGSVRIYDPEGGFIGLGDLAPSGELKPRRIFPS